MRRFGWLLILALIMVTETAAIELQTMATSDWYVRLPSKDYKDLPNLTAESEFVEGNSLGRISFVCDRNNYYLLLIGPFFERKPSEQGLIAVGPATADKFTVTFHDLYGTRNALGSKINWDADILFTDVPAALLTRLTDGGTLTIDLREWSWSIEFKTIAAQVKSFTTFCETGRRLDKSHFRD